VTPRPAPHWELEIERKLSLMILDLAPNRSWVRDFIFERTSSEYVL